MYTFTSRVRFSEVDERGILAIPALVNYLQDCSTFHSEHVGMWPEHVRETGRAWMISAWEIEIDRLPRFGEEITVSTWATGFKGLRANRNFCVRAAEDEGREHPLVRADSSWFIFDAKVGRPIRLPTDEVAPYESDIEHDQPLDLPPIPRILRATTPGEPGAPVVVTAAHLDTNHHVNNAQYVSMALGALSEGQTETGPVLPKIHWLDVHYSQAAKLGDTILPHIHHEPDGSAIVTLDNDDGRPYAIVRIRG